jgi:putative ABC transport system permease protein
MRWLESLLTDVRFGLRMLRKDALVTSAALVSLALAIGACTAAFSLIDALILRALPVHEPNRLAYLTFPTYDPNVPESDSFNYPLFRRLRDDSRHHVDLFAVGYPNQRPAIFPDASGQEERIRPQFVSGDMFQQLGITPALGRLLTPDDDRRPGEHAVAVLSHGFWMRRFGGDPTVLGRVFTFYEHQFQIIGVASAGFTGTEPGRLTDLWVPTMMWNASALNEPGWSWFLIFGRLKPGVQPEQAQAVLQATFTNFRKERAKSFRPDEPPDRTARYVNTPLHVRSAANGPSGLRRVFERPLWILAVVAFLVLLIASSNVANLLIARAAAREREMSLRLSIGAGRGRLIQQVLIESGLLAVAACVLGLIVAMTVAPTVVRMLAPATDPAYLDLRIDWRLLAFVCAIGVVTTTLFGLTPALRASNVAPMGVLKTGGRLTARLGSRPLIATQVAFSLIVVFVAGLLLLSFAKLMRVDPGFNKEGLVLLNIEARELHNDRPRQRIAGLHLLDRVRQLPGVEHAAMAGWGFFEGSSWTAGVRIPGRAPEAFEPHFLSVSPGFFETMGMRVLDGRTFTAQDGEPERPTAAIVNEAFVRRYFPRERAIGRVFGRPERKGDVRQEIVGVVNNAKYGNLRQPAPPTVYVPLQNLGTLHVRTAGDPLSLVPTLRREIPADQPLLRVTTVMLQSTLIDNTLLGERLLALLSGFFGIVGLLLAAVGLYGVLSYAVVQRTREIGVRVALGARPAMVVRIVLGHIVWVIAIGMVAGLAGGLFLSRFVKTMLYEVEPLDVWSIALPVGGLLLAAIAAAMRPARRAARMDPVVALRYE